MRPEPKDFARINNIIARAKGQSWKERQLAENMARSIQDQDKAERRGRAALAFGRNELAVIFLRRAGELAA